MKLLLRFGADPNEICNGLSPLLLSAKVHGVGDQMAFDFEKLLIDSGADPFLVVEGETVLSYAAASGNLQLVKFLWENCHQLGVLPPQRSPLAVAIQKRHFPVTSFLLMTGANPNGEVLVGEKTVSILDLALMRRDGRTITMLIDCGADLNMASTRLLETVIENWHRQFPAAKPSKGLEKLQSMDDLVGAITDFEEAARSLPGKLKSGKALEISSKISDLRKCLQLAMDATEKAESLSNEIDSRRQGLLDIQSKHFAIEDKAEMESLFEKDMAELKQFLEGFSGKMAKAAEAGGNDFLQLHEELSSFADNTDRTLQDFVFEKFDQIHVKSTGKERTDLVFLNKALGTLMTHIAKLFTLFTEVRREGEAFLARTLNTLQEYQDTIRNIAKNEQTLVRMGFKSDIYAELTQENGTKEEVIQATLQALETEKENVATICTTLHRTLNAMAR